jgi:hypothetical protein
MYESQLQRPIQSYGSIRRLRDMSQLPCYSCQPRLHNPEELCTYVHRRWRPALRAITMVFQEQLRPCNVQT